MHLPCLSQLAASPPTPAKAFWCHYWLVAFNSNRSTFPLRPCWECPRSIRANSSYSRREQNAHNPHPTPKNAPSIPIPMLGRRRVWNVAPTYDFPGLSLPLNYPRGSRGLGRVGSAREVPSRPRATYRTRLPAGAADVQKAAGTSNIPRASTSRGFSIRSGAHSLPVRG